jgi:hypothetical protein
VTENVIELANFEVAVALENIARDPTVAAYLERFPVEDRDRALRDRILEKLGRWAVGDSPARLASSLAECSSVTAPDPSRRSHP